MSNDAAKDQDLLARLNALKKTPVDLETRIHQTPGPQLSGIDLNPARSLHSDLLSRFKSLSGNTASSSAKVGSQDEITVAGKQPGPKDESEMTVEELLADLGPADQWNIDKSEEEQVSDLLKSANLALSQGPILESIPDSEDGVNGPSIDEGPHDARSVEKSKALPAVDVSIFQPEPESDPEDDETETKPKPTKKEAMQEFEREADDVLKRLMDEVKYESSQQQQNPESDDGNVHNDENSNSRSSEIEDNADESVSSPRPKPAGAFKSSASTRTNNSADLNLPTAPSKEPPPAYSTIFPAQSTQATAEEDNALAARFANLSLPSAPTSTPQSKPTSSSKNTTSSASKPSKGFSDDEIDTWCIICSDDATLSCIGCDGDLYCTNCWLEGHRGEDAGFEERRHKAVQYNKGSKKKGKTKRVAMGA